MTEKKRGAPEFAFDQAIADEICERTATRQEGLLPILDGMTAEGWTVPGATTIYTKWLPRHKEFADAYTLANQIQTQIGIDGLKNLGKETLDMVLEEADSKRCAAIASVQKMRSDDLKWVAGRLLSKKYGDRIDLEHGGKVEISVHREALIGKLIGRATAQLPSDTETES